MSDAAVSLLVLGCAIALFVWNRLPVGVVAILTALSLAATGVIDVPTALAGFGDPVVIFIAGLFVVSAGLEDSGVTSWVARALIDKAGTKRTSLLVAVMLLSALLSALITPNGAVAALLPVVIVAARRAGLSPSGLLIPVAFGGSAGALLTLSGSPVNVIVSEAAVGAGGRPFGFFEFALAGVPLVIGTIVCAVLGHRLLPDRVTGSVVADYGGHLDTLVEHYSLDQGFFRLGVPASGAPAAQVLENADVQVVGVQDRAGDPAPVDRPLHPGDVVVVTGPYDAVQRLAADAGLTVVSTPLTRQTRESLLNGSVGVAEVVVAPRSSLIGETFFPGLVRGAITVLGVSRYGRDRGAARTTLVQGDALLVHGTWPAVQALEHDADVLVVDSPELVRRQTVPLGGAAVRAVGVLVLMVALLATGAVAPAVAGLIAATAMVILRVVSPAQAYRSISWQALVLIGGLIPLSVAIRESGAATLIADRLVDLVGSGHPLLLLVALFALSAGLGQVISNTATSLVVVPIAIEAGLQLGLDLHTVLMTVTVACGASFLTPIATPPNMMVMAPGGYRFGDFWKLGGVTMLFWLVVGVLGVAAIWGP